MTFSVLLSIYHKENVNYFNKSMNSIWNEQSIKPNEIVLVQDGSLTDELYKSIDNWKMELGNVLKIIPLEINVGLGKALNVGLRHCSHELIARMDTDDISLPYRFEKQLAAFKNSDIDVLGSYSQEIDENDKTGNIRKMPLTHTDIYDNLFTNPFIHPSVMFKKSFIDSLGGYNTSLKRRQDYDLWFKCAKNGAKFENIGEALLLYRFTSDTHRKQNLKLMFDQAKIGFGGVKLLKQPYWKAFACYIPVIRTILPNKVQHFVYKVLKQFDPREK